MTGEESQRLRHDPPRTYEDLMERYGRRMGRAMVEAYTQDGLLSHMELQWISLTSIATVSRALDWYQRQHQVILPCPGTVLDMGRTLTHTHDPPSRPFLKVSLQVHAEAARAPRVARLAFPPDDAGRSRMRPTRSASQAITCAVGYGTAFWSSTDSLAA